MAHEKSPAYYYIGNSSPTKIKATTKPSPKNKNNNEGDLHNPLFNFEKSFGDNLLKLTTADLAQAQPYINIEIKDLGGKTISNLNVDFFQKQVDFEAIKGPGRFSDRPLISLKDIQITTDQSSGYFYFVKVNINLKIHKKDDLSDRAVLGLLFPGCPLLLTYGWNTNSKNEFLSKCQQRLMLNVVSYDLSLDETGQADLSVSCMAFNDVIENTIIGDLNTIEKSNDTASGPELDAMFSNYKGLSSFVEYLDGLSKDGQKNSNDYSLITNSTKSYRNLLQKTEGKIQKNFQQYLDKLSDKSLRTKFSFGKQGKVSDIDVISFYDIVFFLCDETFKSMSCLVPCSSFEIVYGAFNEQCLDYSGKSIADFPIDYHKFMKWIANQASSGLKTIYIKDLLNTLCRDFIENDEYLRQTSNSQADVFQRPNMAVGFINTGGVLTLYVADLNSGVPPTTNQIKDLKKASSKEAQDKILNGTNIPTIALGNANSFIKNVTFSRIDDAYMESVLIERSLNNSMYSPRSGILNWQLQQSQDVKTPLMLPLQGTAKMIGHVAWMPMRAFYLSSGIFLVDAIYIITKVTHTLSSEGFETQIEFMWH